MVFDPTDRAQRRFNGYGPAELPCARDVELDAFVEQLRGEGPAAVRRALAGVSEKGRAVLRAYAERMASLALRRRDPALLVRAAVALVVGGLDSNEPEALMVMSLVDDAARRLGVELADLFEEAANVAGHPGAVNLAMWLMRKPEDRSIASMGFAAGADGGGFRYRLDW